jgi:serpin B
MIRNPLTGYWIKTDGPTYLQLRKNGVCLDVSNYRLDDEGAISKFYCKTLAQRAQLKPWVTQNQDAARMPYGPIPAKPVKLPIVPSRMQMFDASINELTIDLFAQLPISQAIVMSPFSIYCALLMVYLGARGQTKHELQRLLRIKSGDDQVIGNLSTLKTLSPSQSGSQAQFLNSNALVIRQGYPIERTYRDLFTLVFGGDLLSFRDRMEAVMRTNNWVARKTSNLIQNFISESDITDQTQMIIVNTVYFKAQWAIPFKPERTELQLFKGFESNIDLQFMSNLNRNFRYFEDRSAQYLELLYTDSDYAFRLALPKLNQPSQLVLSDLVRNVGRLGEIKFQPNFVSLSMPKFTHRKRLDLKNLLQSLGVHTLFNQADLSLISSQGGLSVSKIIHEAVVKIDENRTEAAAATAVVMRAMAVAPSQEEPIKFIADRPFFYEIINVPRNVILFSGIYDGK